MKLFLILVFVIGLILVGVYSLLHSPNPTAVKSVSEVKTETTSEVAQSAPTPIPFYELTIPYLRQRDYQSKLSSLEPVATSATYTSSVTSYTSDGLKINGLLTQPVGEQPAGGWPAIVFVHGYIPPNQYRTQEKYIDYVNYLARNGFVVFKIDLRGHGSSEGEAGGGYYSSDYVIDTLNAIASLKSTDFVNPNKIGLWGHSMAGNVLMRSLAAQPTIPAIVIWSGAGYTYTDLRENGISDSSYQAPPSETPSQVKRKQLFETYGNFNADSSFWKQVVPTNYLSDIKGAIQLNHAVDDNVVSIEYSRNLNQILDGTSIVHELHEYPSGGHNINGSSFGSAMQNTVDFFKRQLK